MTAIGLEITMELLTDIASALRNVAKDFLPLAAYKYFVAVQPNPPVIVLRIPGPTNKPVQNALYQLAESCKHVTDRAIPSLKLRYMVIGGSEASGIEVTVHKMEQGPVYGHIIKAKVDWLQRSKGITP